MTEWFRSWHGAPTDNKWLVIARRAGVSPGIVSAIAWALLDHASQAEPRGCVTDFDVETYAAFSGFDEEVITRVINVMAAKGVIVDNSRIVDNSTIVDNQWKNWSKRQPKREDETAAQRQRRFRKRHRPNGLDTHAHETDERVSRDVTQRHALSRTVTTDQNRAEQSRAEQRRADKRGGALSSSVETSSQTSHDDDDVGTTPFPMSGHRKGTRLPEGFSLTPDLRSYGLEQGLSHDDVPREFDRIKHHYLSAAGPSSVRYDWPETFRAGFREAAAGKRQSVIPLTRGSRGARISRLEATLRGTALAEATGHDSGDGA